jgi:hypothetical protein
VTAEEKPRVLTRLVILDGVVWNEGDVPPPEVAALIRNPKCWAPVEADANPWGPEGRRTPSVNVMDTGMPVIPSEPGTNGIPNLTEQPADTISSTVVPAAAGTVNGLPLPDPEPVVAESEPVEEMVAPVLPEPPRSGKGATEAAWRAYAAQLDVDVTAAADRGDIIARLRDDGRIQ